MALYVPFRSNNFLCAYGLLINCLYHMLYNQLICPY